MKNHFEGNGAFQVFKVPAKEKKKKRKWLVKLKKNEKVQCGLDKNDTLLEKLRRIQSQAKKPAATAALRNTGRFVVTRKRGGGILMADFLSAILLLMYCRRDCGARRLVFAYVGKKKAKYASVEIGVLIKGRGGRKFQKCRRLLHYHVPSGST